MKIQAKSLIASFGLVRLPTSQRPSGGDGGKPALLGGAPAPNLQALAAELHQSATQGLFEYPTSWVRISRAAGVLFVALAAFRLLSVALPFVQAVAAHTPTSNIQVSPWGIASVAFGVFMSILVAALLVNLFPSIRITPQGLGISELIGWRRVSWTQIGILRVMELENERYVLMIPFKGSTRPPTPAPILRLIPMLAGVDRGGGRGLIVTSYIKNFDRLVQLIVAYMAQSTGQSMPRVELFVDESAVMPIAQLILQPDSAIVRMARMNVPVDPFGTPIEDAEPELSWPKVLPRQALIALPAALLLLVSASARFGNATPPWDFLLGALAIFALGVLELPFTAKLIQVVGDIIVGSGQFKRSARASLELQVPRAVLISLGVVLVSLGLPTVIAQICWMAGIGLTTWLTVRFVQRLYYVALGQTLMAGMGALLLQLAIFALYFGIS